MKIIPFLILVLSFFIVIPSSAQVKKNQKNDSDMKLIYSSEWDWDWHCNCRSERSDKHRNKNKRNKHSYYRSYYSNDGVDNELDIFSQIGPNPALYGFSPSVQALHYNRVNGLFLGIDTEFEDFIHDFTDLHGFDVQALVGYSIGRKNWQYQVGLEKSIGRRFRLGADYHNLTATEDYWRSGLTENSLSSLVAGYDYHDYHKAEGFSVYGSLRVFRRSYLGLSYNTDSFSSLDAITAYNIYGEGNIFRANPSIDSNLDEFYHQSIGISTNINPRLYNITHNLSTSLTFRGEIGNLPGTSNQFMFNKYILQSKSVMRLDRSTFLKWRVMGGSITGTAPDFKNFTLGGIGTMRATDYKSLQGNTMILSNAEIVFGKNSDIDLGFTEIEGFYISLFMDSGWSEFNSELTNATDPTIGFQNFQFSDLAHNLGIGFGSDLLRVEFAKSLEEKGGFSAFWIRLNPTF